MHRLLALHQSQRVQHIRDLLCILLRKTDRLLALDASGLIREPVLDCPTFAILAHKANDGHGALEGAPPNSAYPAVSRNALPRAIPAAFVSISAAAMNLPIVMNPWSWSGKWR
jgi:hypothetical protein